MKKNDLYELVNGLTPAEKKTFKEKYAAKESTNFLRLFDAISSGEVKDDDEAKAKFAGENFTTHLHKTKAYLYESLLALLLIHLQNNFPRLALLQKIEYAEVLMSRKLFTPAEDMLLDALQMTKNTEEFELELFILVQLSAMPAVTHQHRDYFKQMEEVLDKMKQVLFYRNQYFKVMNTYLERGKKGAVDLEKELRELILKKDEKILSGRAENSFEAIRGLFFLQQSNRQKSYEGNLRLVALTKANVSYSLSEIGYINSLFNLVSSAAFLPEASKHISQTIAELETFQPVSRLAQSTKFTHLSRMKMQLVFVNGEKGEAKKLKQWLKSELQLHQPLIAELDLVKIYFSMAELLLREKEYDEALDYINYVLNSKIAREDRPVQFRIANLFQLIAHYELHHFDLLGSILRNYQYFQKTHDSLYEIEKLTIDFLRKAITLPDETSRKKIKEKFENEIFNLSQQEELNGTNYFHLTGWVRADYK